MSSPNLFQSTLPLRGATLVGVHTTLTPSISIHTPLAGSDQRDLFGTAVTIPISIHTPLAGSDRTARRPANAASNDFNPHSPCGERLNAFRGCSRHYNFNPHSPCGERLKAVIGCSRHYNFNPHSPCGERPFPTRPLPISTGHFNPHSPCGERHYLGLGYRAP